MKLILSLFLAVILVSCSTDGSGEATIPSGDGQGGSLTRFALSGDYLYTVDDQSLNVFNISNAAIPTFVNEKFIGFDIETLYALDEYLFVGSRLGMYIYDISDPKFPLRLAEVQHLRSCDPVVSSGDYTYVTLHTSAACEGDVNQLEIYDTTNPLQPELLRVIQLDRPIGLGLYGNYLLVTDAGVIRIFDVSDPAQPDLAGGIETDAFDLIIRGNELFVIGANSLKQYVLDPTDIGNLSFRSSIDF